MTLILHRNRRRRNEEKLRELRGELPHRHYFSHGCLSRVPSQSPNYLTLSVALFSPYFCEPMWREINRMVHLNLEVRASTPQESPDYRHLGRTLEQRQQTPGE